MTLPATTSPAPRGMPEAATVSEFIALNVLCFMEAQPELVFNPKGKPIEVLAKECAARISVDAVEQVLHDARLDSDADRDILALEVIVAQLEKMGAMLNAELHDAFVGWIPSPSLLPH